MIYELIIMFYTVCNSGVSVTHVPAQTWELCSKASAEVQEASKQVNTSCSARPRVVTRCVRVSQ